MLVGAATVVTVTDIDASMAYYCDVLGFDVTFDYGEPIFYAGLCRDEVMLHLRAAPALSSRRRITPMACATLTLTISTAIA